MQVKIMSFFRRCFNVSAMSDDGITLAKGPVTENARSTNLVLVRGMS